ncbi:restriction endonuclease subunit S [Shewanella xiamenensis]|uniref:restriction endonuclease subunit S n=1 Tax=Shewanella xiamenensis TaxID=332186 RepID=UPI0035B7B6A2
MSKVGKPLLSFDKQAHYEISTGTAINSISSGVSVNSEDVSIQNENELGILKTSCVSAGSFIPAENKKVIAVDYQRVKKPVKAGTIIVSRMNTPLLVGEVGYVDKSIDNLFLPDRLWEIGVKPEYNARWLANYLITPKIKFRLKELATGTSDSMKNISQPSFLSIQIFAPSYNEQQKIADFLTAVDSKISQLTEKQRLLNEYKKGAMQQLFSQQLRFKDKDGNAFPEWKEDRLDSFIKRVNDPVYVEQTTEYCQIGIRCHGKGIFHKDKVTGAEIGNKRVFWVHTKALVINIVFAWERAIAVTSENEKGFIASHRFPMYVPVEDKSDLDYLLYFFLSPRGEFLLNLASPGGAGRNKTLGQAEFSRLKVKLPSLAEQQKITQFLQAIDNKIAAVAEQIEQTKQFKKGLLQQMFV